MGGSRVLYGAVFLFCVWRLDFVKGGASPVPSPATADPTSPRPTTAMPTPHPSSPSARPTASPTNPTARPSVAPTPRPTPVPSPEPTSIPTLTTYEELTFTMLNVPSSLLDRSIYSNFALVAASEAVRKALNTSSIFRQVGTQLVVGNTEVLVLGEAADGRARITAVFRVRPSNEEGAARLRLRQQAPKLRIEPEPDAAAERRALGSAPTSTPAAKPTTPAPTPVSVTLITPIRVDDTNTGDNSVRVMSDSIAAKLLTTFQNNVALFLATFKDSCKDFMNDRDKALVAAATISAASITVKALHPTLEPTTDPPSTAPVNILVGELEVIEGNPQMALIVGASLGGVLFLILVVLLCLYRQHLAACCKKKAATDTRSKGGGKGGGATGRNAGEHMGCVGRCCGCRKKATPTQPTPGINNPVFGVTKGGGGKPGSPNAADDDDDDEEVSSSEEEGSGEDDGEQTEDDEEEEEGDDVEGTGLALQTLKSDAVTSPFHAASSPADFNRRASLGEVAKAKSNPLASSGGGSPTRNSQDTRRSGAK